MPWTDFYMDVGTGSNLNSGSTNTSSPLYSSTGGNWDGTSVFTPTDGSTPASSVTAGDWVSIYPTGNTVTPYIAQVTSVAAGANGAITCSTTLKFGTAPSAGSGTRNLIDGGRVASDNMVATGAAWATGTVTQDTRLNIKASTYTTSGVNRTFALAGTATALLWYRGYQTTPGDQDGNQGAVAGTNIPLFTSNDGYTFSGAYSSVSNLHFTSSTASFFVLSFTGGNQRAYNVRAVATSASGAAALNISSSSGIQFASFYVSAPTTGTTQAITCSTTANFFGGYVRGGAIGLTCSATVTVEDVIFDSQVGDAIKSTASLVVLNCAIYNAGGNGVNLSTLASSVVVKNCYFSTITGVSKAAINNTSGASAGSVALINNAYYNCTATLSGIQESFAIFDQGVLASEAFANPSGGNFALVSAFQNTGFPDAFENLSTTLTSRDIGPAQHSSSGGGPTGGIMRVVGQSFPCH